jgi:DNA-binding transcriptional LysR family regulator
MPDLRGLDLTLLKALDALLDERHVTRAAQRVGVSQPAMSGMLTRLREAFGDPLFVRAPRGIVPTARALALATPVKRVLGEIEALLQPAAFDPASAQLSFTVAATDYALRAVAMPFLALLRMRAPQVRVALVAIEHALVQRQLERGEVDLALLTPDATPPDLHARTLFDEHYVCALRADHPALRDGAPDLERFCALDHALVSFAGSSFHGVADAALAALGRRRRVTLSVHSFLILPELLRASDLVATVPSRLLAGVPGLATFAPPLAIPGFSKTAAWHARSHRDPAQRWLRELLFASVAAESTPAAD